MLAGLYADYIPTDQREDKRDERDVLQLDDGEDDATSALAD